MNVKPFFKPLEWAFIALVLLRITRVIEWNVFFLFTPLFIWVALGIIGIYIVERKMKGLHADINKTMERIMTGAYNMDQDEPHITMGDYH